jgi:hypothetical protein
MDKDTPKSLPVEVLTAVGILPATLTWQPAAHPAVYCRHPDRFEAAGPALTFTQSFPFYQRSVHEFASTRPSEFSQRHVWRGADPL